MVLPWLPPNEQSRFADGCNRENGLSLIFYWICGSRFGHPGNREAEE
jgi:hypothetical protein